MELRLLQYFLAITREKSISAAAESLHISQPTLSTQLKKMEEELGKQLLIRGSRGARKVILTEEGMILRRRAEEILNLVQKTEKEITLSDETIVGDVYIGSGETEIVRLVAKAAQSLQEKYPDIRYHISSGNAAFVMEQLEKGMIDFGILYDLVDQERYGAVQIPMADTWGVLMRKDSALAEKESVSPEDLWDKPLILSEQENQSKELAAWLRKDISKLRVVATYNLLFNGSLLVDEGMGYAICLDKLINTTGDSRLCFRPLSPKLEATAYLVWKKYPVFSKAAEKFIQKLREFLI